MRPGEILDPGCVTSRHHDGLAAVQGCRGKRPPGAGAEQLRIEGAPDPAEVATTNRGLNPVSPVPRARRPPAAGRRCREVSALLMQPSLPGPRTAKKTASFLAMTLPGTRPRRGVTLASWRRPAALASSCGPGGPGSDPLTSACPPGPGCAARRACGARELRSR